MAAGMKKAAWRPPLSRPDAALTETVFVAENVVTLG
jgi:hypothetical protein